MINPCFYNRHLGTNPVSEFVCVSLILIISPCSLFPVLYFFRTYASLMQSFYLLPQAVLVNQAMKSKERKIENAFQL